MKQRTYGIGEASRLSGVSVRRLRFYADKGLLPPAITALRHSVELDPTNATTSYHLALAYEKSGDRTEAVRMLQRYLQLDSTSERSAEVKQRLRVLGA